VTITAGSIVDQSLPQRPDSRFGNTPIGLRHQPCDLRSRGSVSGLQDVTRFAADRLVTRVSKSNSYKPVKLLRNKKDLLGDQLRKHICANRRTVKNPRGQSRLLTRLTAMEAFRCAPDEKVACVCRT
jgi:hypothetical protein